jgi:uncharacterized phage protein gp47/JayE
MIPKKGTQEILQKSLDGIVQETDIKLVSPGSVARAICGAHAKTLAEAYDVLDDVVINGFLPTASGFYLDLIGQTFNVPRGVDTPGTVTREDKNLRFFVRSGSLAQKLPHPTNLNLGRIPSGTQISGGGVTYLVDQTYDFPASSSEAFVGAVSSGRGVSQNAAAGQLTTHNLNATGLFVENQFDITSSTSVESDAEYRFRISQTITASQGANEAAIRLVILSAPGVADMIRTPYHAGPGSFKVVVIPTSNRLPFQTLLQINNSLRATVAYGIFYQVEEPRYLPVSLSIRLSPRSGTISVNPTDRDAAEAAVRRYLGNVRPGQSLVINQLRAAVLNASQNIGDVTIQSLYINRAPRVLTNFTLKNDELLIPDENVQNPILVI